MSATPAPEALLHENPDGVFAVDADGTILYANPAGARLLAQREGDLVGSQWAFDLSREETIELELNDGVVAEMHRVPTTWDGAPAWLATMRNVTRRKEASREVARSQRRLLAMSVEAGQAQLARAIVHNSGNVLNAVTVGMSTLEERLGDLRIRTIGRVARRIRGEAGAPPPTPEELGRHAALLDAVESHLEGERARLLAEVATLRDRVDHLRSVLQLEHATRGPRLVELISFDEIVEAAVTAQAPACAREEIALTVTYGRVPDAQLDRHQLHQVVVNLLVNARESVQDVPRDRRRIHVRTECADGVARATITDSGAGFGPEVARRLFEAGFTTKQDGLGYGLHASAVAAQSLGGALTGDSAGVGLGAVFVLEVPLSTPVGPRYR